MYIVPFQLIFLLHINADTDQSCDVWLRKNVPQRHYDHAASYPQLQEGHQITSLQRHGHEQLRPHQVTPLLSHLMRSSCLPDSQESQAAIYKQQQLTQRVRIQQGLYTTCLQNQLSYQNNEEKILRFSFARFLPCNHSQACSRSHLLELTCRYEQSCNL